VYQASNEGRAVTPADIEDKASPPWWPKTGEELFEEAKALGLV
jgi:hypothetical protein